MIEPTPTDADDQTGRPGEIVRRFDRRKNVWRAKKSGIKFDKNKGNGIPATTIDIEPVDPDRIKEATGARSADAWLDINIRGKKVLRRTTKSGRKEIVILEDVNARDVVTWGRTVQTWAGAEDEDAT